MLKDITLGQYIPGKSLVHRTDPRIKLAAVVIYIAAIFCAKTLGGYALLTALLILVILNSKIAFSLVWKSIKSILIFIILTAIVNVFFTTGDHVLFQWKFITISTEGILFACAMIARLILLITGSSMLTYTTSPIALTDALESVFSPLKKIRFPVHELAMMTSIALRFIPTLIEETDKIMSAQKSRGADFESGNLFKRAKALVPILIPLFINSFRRADELATAIECRAYHGGEGRTKYRLLKTVWTDYAVLSGFLIFLGAVIVLRIFGI